MQTPITRSQVVTLARQYLDYRWQHQARYRGTKPGEGAVDCIGLLLLVAEDLGILDPATIPANYQRQFDPIMLMKLVEQYCERISPDQLQPGDVVLLARGPLPLHAGIIGQHPVTGGLSLIHAYAEEAQVVEQNFTDQWRRWIRGSYRLPNIVEG